MLVIGDDGSIQLTRGDTAYIQISLYNDATDRAYVMEANDRLIMSVKRSVKDAEYCFQKEAVGTNIFHILSSDTQDCSFATYKYDVQLITAAGEVCTVVAPSSFKVCAEVTI